MPSRGRRGRGGRSDADVEDLVVSNTGEGRKVLHQADSDSAPKSLSDRFSTINRDTLKQGAVPRRGGNRGGQQERRQRAVDRSRNDDDNDEAPKRTRGRGRGRGRRGRGRGGRAPRAKPTIDSLNADLDTYFKPSNNGESDNTAETGTANNTSNGTANAETSQ